MLKKRPLPANGSSGEASWKVLYCVYFTYFALSLPKELTIPPAETAARLRAIANWQNCVGCYSRRRGRGLVLESSVQRVAVRAVSRGRRSGRLFLPGPL